MTRGVQWLIHVAAKLARDMYRLLTKRTSQYVVLPMLNAQKPRLRILLMIPLTSATVPWPFHS